MSPRLQWVWYFFWRASTFIAACCFTFNMGWQWSGMWERTRSVTGVFVPILIISAIMCTADLVSNIKFFRKYRTSHRDLVEFVKALPETRNRKNCPFYGFAPTHRMLPVMIPTRGNQCALVEDAHAPCYLEIDGKEVDWRTCQRVGALRGE